MFVQRLTSATAEQIHRMVTVLTEAFLDEPFQYAIHHGQPSLLYLTFRSVVTTALLDAEVWVSGQGSGSTSLSNSGASQSASASLGASTAPTGGQSSASKEEEEDVLESRQIEGVMMVYPSGVKAGDTPNAQGPHYQLAQASLSDESKHVQQQLMTAFHSLISSSFGPQAEREMVYIGELGVAPQAQGSGLGRAMVRAVLDREQQRQRACREEGQKGGSDVILFTAAERSKTYYESMGFQVGGEVPSDLLGGDGRMWAMRWSLPEP